MECSAPFCPFFHVSVPFQKSTQDRTICVFIPAILLNLSLHHCHSVLNRLQHIQNSLARAVVAAPRCSDANQILKSLHWLKVPDRIEYKVISVTYKLLQSSAPHYLRDLITIQSARSTRSSSLVTLLHPPVQSNLKITKRSFRHAAPHLWNKLPPSLRIPSTGSIPSFSDSHHGPVFVFHLQVLSHRSLIHTIWTSL